MHIYYSYSVRLYCIYIVPKKTWVNTVFGYNFFKSRSRRSQLFYRTGVLILQHSSLEACKLTKKETLAQVFVSLKISQNF